jgi:hypothetical protein
MARDVTGAAGLPAESYNALMVAHCYAILTPGLCSLDKATPRPESLGFLGRWDSSSPIVRRLVQRPLNG